ncbi:uncharacterized protein LOC143257098 isoform X1 [Tachypleus tridentatus]|uniref:uncharacterized protein LOC143257098 isoform X1 n=1 Tax=Tachypleus tridentatus TaxID=6853 RepID=UPI003FD4022D
MYTQFFVHRTLGMFLCVSGIIFGVLLECTSFAVQKGDPTFSDRTSSVSNKVIELNVSGYSDVASSTTESSSGVLHQKSLPYQDIRISNSEFMELGLSDAVISGHMPSKWPLNKKRIPTISTSFPTRISDASQTSSSDSHYQDRVPLQHHSRNLDFSQGWFETLSTDLDLNFRTVTSVDSPVNHPKMPSGTVSDRNRIVFSGGSLLLEESNISTNSYHSKSNNPGKLKGFFPNDDHSGHNSRAFYNQGVPDADASTKISQTIKKSDDVYYFSFSNQSTLSPENKESESNKSSAIPIADSDFETTELYNQNAGDTYSFTEAIKKDSTAVSIPNTFLESEKHHSSISPLGNFPENNETVEGNKIEGMAQLGHLTSPQDPFVRSSRHSHLFDQTARNYTSAEKSLKNVTNPTDFPNTGLVTWIAKLDNSSHSMEKNRHPSGKYPSSKTNPDIGLVNDQPAGFNVERAPANPPSIMGPVSEARDSRQNTMSNGAVAGIVVGIISLAGLTAVTFLLLHNKDYCKAVSNLDSKCSSDSCAYIDDSLRTSYMNSHIELPKDSIEEMSSLDNDSFLNSLEAVTIQNYWADNSKNTKV